MPSLIPGYEYDIFISYRHKDNKYDGWVSDFVANLKRELEATFKEEVSVYFDENPHEGLLETHNVDKSLEGKLKCLIFIPIISQTYCDLKSFAWQHELCAFNKMAKEDQFGRDIKLRNGNVTSRILPVKIHDLNAQDKALFENELGGVIRAIEFIFKSAGVNRPLRAREDHPHDNLNKTFYRDQINKLANAIKEIIECLIHPEKDPSSEDSSFMPQHRQLSAILFTDIEGYTSLMQQSEQKAMVMKDRHRQIIQQEHKEFNGRVIQYTGDGTLSTFQSIVEAVKCALSMQQQFLQEPQVPVRMGLHIGDIIFNDEDIFGDGVNLASRIESLSVAGSVLISDKANEELHNHPSLKTVSVGVYQFKNVKRAVEVFALNHEGLVKPALNSLTGKTEEKYSGPTTRKRWPLIVTTAGTFLLTALLFYLIFYFITPRTTEHPDKWIAVLPFEDLSEKHDQEYFTDGMMVDIINRLSKIGDLHVISRTSAMKYKDAKSSVTEIARELGVTSILEGTVRKSGDRVKISVDLIDPTTEKHLWSEDYDFRDLKDIFAVQSEVSRRVAETLKVRLTSSEKESLAKKNTENPEAYNFYLKGRFFWAQRTDQSYDSAELNYKKAIQLDPGYALAYSGLADCYTLGQQGMTSVEETPIATAYLKKALSIDSTLCEALTTMGFIQSHMDYDWEKGKKTLEKAIRINPSYSIAHLYYGNTFIFTGDDIEKGLSEVRTALDLDPLSSSVNWALGNRYFLSNKPDLAVKQFQKTLVLDPNYAPASTWLALSYLRKGMSAEAISLLSRLPEKLPMRDIGLGLAHAESGDKDQAKKDADKILEAGMLTTDIGPIVIFASLQIKLNNYDAALTLLEQAYAIRSLNLMGLKIDPYWDPIRDQPRFKALLKKMNFD